ncbi:F-box domain-containing protein [Caenorhabditis elegans]|uniref:F-box domain-containing protein n=1 Tax=Caenorhabditis elegans TaxID=6239 RepID=Q17830_CAEEL|nr:F-box domain-containing protein [Caenorhabditis elegans]CAA97426.2 F-box domain-containing protein [Caenorhabditis elegans]|eukprot:NP_502092.2 F-box B protein [Caenorhabditis elegans]
MAAVSEFRLLQLPERAQRISLSHMSYNSIFSLSLCSTKKNKRPRSKFQYKVLSIFFRNIWRHCSDY